MHVRNNNYKFPPIQVGSACNGSNRLAMTALEAAPFVFLDFFKISLPYPCNMASLKFGWFFQFFQTGEKPVALGNVT